MAVDGAGTNRPLAGATGAATLKAPDTVPDAGGNYVGDGEVTMHSLVRRYIKTVISLGLRLGRKDRF